MPIITPKQDVLKAIRFEPLFDGETGLISMSSVKRFADEARLDFFELSVDVDDSAATRINFDIGGSAYSVRAGFYLITRNGYEVVEIVNKIQLENKYDTQS